MVLDQAVILPSRNAAAQAVDEQGAVVAAPDVVLAGPHELDRPAGADRLGHSRQAQRRNACSAARDGRSCRRPAWSRAPPCSGVRPRTFAIVMCSPVCSWLPKRATARCAVPPQKAVERLHRRVREIRKDELGLDHALGAGQRGLRIAMGADHGRRDGAASARYSATSCSLPRRSAPDFIPGDSQRLARLCVPARSRWRRPRRPSNLLHVDDAGHGAGRLVVERCDPGAEARRPCHRRRSASPARGYRSRTARCRSSCSRCRGAHRPVAADQTERRWILERHDQPERAGALPLPRTRRSVPAGPRRGAARRCSTVISDRRHAPGLRCGLHQHGARCRARLAHLLVGIGHRGRAAGPLRRRTRSSCKARHSHGACSARTCDQSASISSATSVAETGERALAELDVLDEHRHGVVGADAHERVGRERGRAASGLDARAAPDCASAGNGQRRRR